MLDLLRRQLDHERWANTRTIGALEAAAARAPDDDRVERAIDKLRHNLAVRDLWLQRLGGRSRSPDEPAHGASILPKARAWSARGLDEWTGWLQHLGPDRLQREHAFEAPDGATRAIRAADAFTHVYTHGFHHRGQICALLNAVGVAPPMIGYATFLDEASRPAT